MTPFETVLQHYKFPTRINPHPLQVEVINALAPLPNGGMWLDMGCVDSETEYLSPTGWVSISKYDGDQVAQFVPEGNGSKGRAEFVTPLNYIKKPCEEMIVFRTTRGVDQKLSRDHRVPYIRSGGRFAVSDAQSVFDTHESNKMGWKGRFITTFDPPCQKGIPMTDARLRLTVAVIADGHFPSPFAPCTLRVKKVRKIERLRKLLSDAAIKYEELNETWDGCEGFVRFKFHAPLPGVRLFGDRFYEATLSQLQIIVDEVPHWDGSVSDNPNRGFRFSSSEKRSADFVQYALCCVGIRSTVSYSLRVREGRKDSHEYNVQTFARSSLAYLTGCNPLPEGGFEKTKTTWIEPSTDGFQYCFTVPSSYLIMRRNGCVFVTGNCGKTFVYTAIGLYHKIMFGHQVVVTMPPILLRQWERWLKEVKALDDSNPLTVTNYSGTPAKRKELSLDSDFVLAGIQVFKRDYERFVSHFTGKKFSFAIDEATLAGNIESDNHVKAFDFSVGHPQMPMTGTPVGDPMDAYALMKFSAPGVYRNKGHFENMHVEEKDFHKKPTKFKNLELLNENLMTNSARVLFEDMYPDSEEPLFDPIYYDLDPVHYKLYKKLAEEQLLLLPDGGKIDGTTANKLTHALGQIVVNWGHFSGEPANVSACAEMIAQKLSDLGTRRLVVFAHYKMTVSGLRNALARFGAVSINSEVSEKQKDKNVQTFINDPECRVIIIQFISGGKGLDGMQHVCNHMFFAEPCQRSRDFMQCVGRLKRLGQRARVHVMMGIANGTTQVRGFKNLLTNDSLVGQVIRNATDLRNAIFGVDQ